MRDNTAIRGQIQFSGTNRNTGMIPVGFLTLSKALHRLGLVTGVAIALAVATEAALLHPHLGAIWRDRSHLA